MGLGLWTPPNSQSRDMGLIVKIYSHLWLRTMVSSVAGGNKGGKVRGTVFKLQKTLYIYCATELFLSVSFYFLKIKKSKQVFYQMGLDLSGSQQPSGHYMAFPR